MKLALLGFVLLLLTGCSVSSSDIYWNSEGCAFYGSRQISNSEFSAAKYSKQGYPGPNEFPSSNGGKEAANIDFTRKIWRGDQSYDVTLTRLPNYDKATCVTYPPTGKE